MLSVIIIRSSLSRIPGWSQMLYVTEGLNWSSCLCLPGARVPGTNHHTRFYALWDTGVSLRNHPTVSLTGTPCRLEWLTSESRGPPVSTFPTLGVQVCAPYPAFYVAAGVWTQVLMLGYQALCWQSHPPQPLLWFSEIGFHVSCADIQLDVSCWGWARVPVSSSPPRYFDYGWAPPQGKRWSSLKIDPSIFWKWSLDSSRR